MKKLLTVATLIVLFCLLGSGSAFADKRCVNHDDGTMTDTYTGLMWQMGGNPEMSWYDAMNGATTFSWGKHSDWRLPNMDELRGLYASPCKISFYVKREAYWTSVTESENPDYAYLIEFYVGGTNVFEKTTIALSRYVRDVQ